jgi:cytoskeleton protein RodZ
MAYDLASRQSRISFAVQQERETGLPSFGEKLKQEREKRKITLEEISSSTKIGTRMLQALEEDRFNQLPGGIFNKGFVRAYSRFVGLDEDQIVADYLEASGDAPPVSTEIAPREDGSRESEARESAENIRRLEGSADSPAHPLPWGLFAAVLLVIALALSLWSHRRSEHARQSVRPAPTAATTQLSGEVSREASGDQSGAASPTAISPTTTSPRAGSSASTQSASGKASSAAPKTHRDLAPEDLAPKNLSTVAPAATPGEFTVLIQAREESWISITADGKTISRETLEAGSTRAIRGRKEIIVKVGNAGGVDFHFNGKKLDTGGEFGEVKTITFGPEGIVPNAPVPPSTPLSLSLSFLPFAVRLPPFNPGWLPLNVSSF